MNININLTLNLLKKLKNKNFTSNKIDYNEKNKFYFNF